MKINVLLKKHKKKIYGIIGAIFLSSIGAPIWENVILPVLNIFAKILLYIYNFFYSSYVDYIYANVSKMDKEVFDKIIYVMIVTVIILFPIFIFYLNKFKRKESNDNIPKKDDIESIKKYIEKLELKLRNRRKLLKIYIISLIIIYVLYIPLLLSTIITHNAIIYIEKNIEIIRPYMDDKEILQTRSKLRLINNKESFFKLDDELKKIANENNIKLPEYKLLD